MKTHYTKQISNKDEAISFIVSLKIDNELFHFDDLAQDIYNYKNERLFTDEESKQINERVKELFTHLSDPFLYVLMLTDPEALLIE